MSELSRREFLSTAGISATLMVANTTKPGRFVLDTLGLDRATTQQAAHMPPEVFASNVQQVAERKTAAGIVLRLFTDNPSKIRINPAATEQAVLATLNHQSEIIEFWKNFPNAEARKTAELLPKFFEGINRRRSLLVGHTADIYFPSDPQTCLKDESLIQVKTYNDGKNSSGCKNTGRTSTLIDPRSSTVYGQATIAMAGSFNGQARLFPSGEDNRLTSSQSTTQTLSHEGFHIIFRQIGAPRTDSEESIAQTLEAALSPLVVSGKIPNAVTYIN